MADIKLSIIIPAYNAEPYIDHLINTINPQMRDDVEVFVIDDGSRTPYLPPYPWVNVIRQENKGVSAARNTGLDHASGEYIAFIDADDLVADHYISSIIDKIEKEQFDYCYLSWKTMKNGWQCDVKLHTIQERFPSFNLCVWNRIYRREMIGSVRFNTNKLIAEDAEFIREVNEDGKKKAFISDYMYFYRSDTPNSLTKRFAAGQVNTKRIVYYYPHIGADMKDLLEDVKKADRGAEVIVMTNQNDLPELERYAMVTTPCIIKGTELRGEKTSLFKKIRLPMQTQIVIYTQRTYAIGGIETFIYNFCSRMKELYDIIVLYDSMDERQINRLQQYVRVMKNQEDQQIICDSLIINRITDEAPKNVHCKQKIRMVHACKMISSWTIPKDCDWTIPVSQTVEDSFQEELTEKHTVINNMTGLYDRKRELILMSATRLGTFEKGAARMVKLAERLNDAEIPFTWFVFSDRPLEPEVRGIINMKPRLDLSGFLQASDYLVQLSDEEGFCYSIVEALEAGTPVLTTPINVLPEIGFREGVNGYLIPFDSDEPFDIGKIYRSNLKGFRYQYDNDARIKQWKEILGDTVPKHDYHPETDLKKVFVTMQYQDQVLNRKVKYGEILTMNAERAQEVENAGCGQIIEKQINIGTV